MYIYIKYIRIIGYCNCLKLDGTIACKFWSNIHNRTHANKLKGILLKDEGVHTRFYTVII